ncbi:NAD(P)H-dependent flavin oxidoreductase [Commensalibacter communis]|uniref:Nitropropane dioxygenase family (YrpB) n=1 Tax=Commensalibacter communis TaxID=2972786 RepID=A0A9W4TST6_9PROT|nr:nitronate monooxygenase [Commensalibacter communis]CAI3954278.1 NAD(P)H-dependent flavin oxidoreductase YrpB [Commensalibacter communis]CAI3955876.1 NAD(P)H-dependent flavin oxidoreductase YrpB [Commensalibacter communis]CAI3956245.1 NAD(P)H-dependent flavin oxidoreductase YrpB [Commensalibacter communis]CAI3957415.1 NAD(P)H-dependent flavin oxidoreductase YrpB [Commensalibacter communis]CAI3958156.1 NAD(P)H-dependent flavin oxidoreductase YrpB [Commensalibacter communis]
MQHNAVDVTDLDKDAQSELASLWSRGTEFLGSEVAILGGAMSWVSERNLVSAISNAGGFGVIACGAMDPTLLEAEIAGTQAMTTKPFGVNLITMHPQLNELIDVCLKLHVKHIVLAGGVPSGAAIKKIKDGGAQVVAFAPALVLAKRLIKMGADAIVIEGAEAGGHVGPVSLTVLAQEILPVIREVPVFIAGGLGRGDAILSYLEMGASGAQLGTVFAASVESQAHENFKKAFVRAAARDAITTVQIDDSFPVIPVRALANQGTKEFMKHQAAIIQKYQRQEVSKEEAQLDIEHFWAGALRRAVKDGDIENGSVMAGQSVGMVKEILPVETIIHTLVKQAVDALVVRRQRIKHS